MLISICWCRLIYFIQFPKIRKDAWRVKQSVWKSPLLFSFPSELNNVLCNVNHGLEWNALPCDDPCAFMGDMDQNKVSMELWRTLTWVKTKNSRVLKNEGLTVTESSWWWWWGWWGWAAMNSCSFPRLLRLNSVKSVLFCFRLARAWENTTV